ncbi:MAG: hypothetical protein ACFFGP_15410, partial [Promethearchaeota archaeon]
AFLGSLLCTQEFCSRILAKDIRNLFIPAFSIVFRNSNPCNLNEHAAMTTRSISFSFICSITLFNPVSEHKY